jgi:hypothetical protein
MPADLDHYGTLWPAGTFFTSGGPVRVEVTFIHRPWPGSPTGSPLGSVFAVRADVSSRLVPVHAACGQLVDWMM